MKFSNKTLAVQHVVVANWFLPETAKAYLVKWSVITKIISKNPYISLKKENLCKRYREVLLK